MSEIKKGALVAKQVLTDDELTLINRHTLRALTSDEVFIFRVVACDNQVDRDTERFTEDALETMAKLFVGRPFIMDHAWSAAKQTARIYAGTVEDAGNGVKQLILRAYMLRSEVTQPTIDAIEAGILKEVSVGVLSESSTCSICGRDYFALDCPHRRGSVYDGKTCHVDLDGITDAFELSFVAVPAQPGAGVIKRYEGKETDKPPDDEASKLQAAQALLELEYKRFGKE